MPSFVVVVEGTGIKVPSVPEPIIGFMTTRRVTAADEDSAVDKAKRMILDDWQSSEYGTANIGDTPTLKIDSIRSQGLLERVFSLVPTKGYTFYSQE